MLIVPFFVAALTLLSTYLVAMIRHRRLKQWASFPQLPPHAILGHLPGFNKFRNARGDKRDRHPDLVLLDMHVALGRPPIMVVDTRPMMKYVMLVVGDHAVAEQITKPSKMYPNSVLRSPTWTDLTCLVGPQAMVLRDEDDWKRLRKQFHPIFQHQHLTTLLPSILDKSMILIHRLNERVRTAESFSLDRLLKDLSFDLIGRVALDVDLHTQSDTSRPCTIYEAFRALLKSFRNVPISYPRYLAPLRTWKRRQLGLKLDAALRETVRQRLRQLQAGSGEAPSRSILSLSVNGRDECTSDVVDEMCDHIKFFLFAGSDTTGVSIAWALYELSRTPAALAAVRAELDGVFGAADPSPAAVATVLRGPSGKAVLQDLTYLTAVMRETLRLYPPGSTMRVSPVGTGFEVSLPSGERKCLDDAIIYPAILLIGRDPAIFGDDADHFVPERWLGERGARIPASAWRGFERGPRSCLGQELALMEARIVLALVARTYDFVKVGLGELDLDENGCPTLEEATSQYKVKSDVYNVNQVTAQIVDGMMVKVKFL